MPPLLALDHLLIGAATIESGIAWLEERTGVRAALGGSHPGLGTWNALASLGPRQYVEVISLDLSGDIATAPEPRIVATLATPRGVVRLW